MAPAWAFNHTEAAVPLLPVRRARPRAILSVAHADRSSAARTKDGRLNETDYSRLVALEAGATLTALGVDFAVIEQPSLEDKVEVVNEIAAAGGALCAVEAHLNADDGSGDPGFRGTMTLYEKDDEQDRALAVEIADELAAALPWTKSWDVEPAPGRMVHRKKIAFLADTRIPCAMPELLFLSCPREAEWLLHPNSPAILGAAVARGIFRFLLPHQLRP